MVSETYLSLFKAEALYYQALIAYIFYEAPEEEKNMTTLLEMLNASEVREEDETYKNAVDLMFDRLIAIQRNPEIDSKKRYKAMKMAIVLSFPFKICQRRLIGKKYDILAE